MLPIKIELPEGFLKEEVRCGYTVSVEMKKLWPGLQKTWADLFRGQRNSVGCGAA